MWYILNPDIAILFADSEESLKKTAQYLIDSCKPGSSVCLICIASIKHVDAVSILSCRWPPVLLNSGEFSWCGPIFLVSWSSCQISRAGKMKSWPSYWFPSFRLKVDWVIDFSCMKIFFTAYFVHNFRFPVFKPRISRKTSKRYLLPWTGGYFTCRTLCDSHVLLQSFRMRRMTIHTVNHFTTQSHSCYVNQIPGILQVNWTFLNVT